MSTGPKRRRRGQPAVRKPLAQPPAPIHVEGDAALAEVLRRALADLDRRAPDALTHGFHSYPARMHPAVAAHVLDALASRSTDVLDPFCGSGTVALECVVGGNRFSGIDLNPLALRIAEVRCERRRPDARERFARVVGDVAARSEERVRGRVAVRAPLHPQETRWYDPHVLKELAGLREEILAVEDVRDRRALEVVFSAIVVKFSRQRADTAERVAPKRIRKGLVTEFFGRKGHELVERWAQLDARAPPRAPRPRFVEGDARKLSQLLGAGYRAGLVLTSPPYGGTYDYAFHHARRFAWLGLDTRRLQRGEIGARRQLQGNDGAAAWDRQVLASLRALARVLDRGGTIVMMVGDAQIDRRRIAADRQMPRLASHAGLEVRATASQLRPDWTGGPERKEHLIALRAAAAKGS